ncbi:ABC transporter [Asanoa ishikariensis]|uniref:ABC transporter n=1 Tax=Asanoa ishikariensis TaxID=137265 RepID=UPI00115F9B65|nr:ABC transporter [Asanoa ishikariensis]
MRAARWTPVLAALLVGYAMVGVPAVVSGPSDPATVVVLLRLAVLCAGLGVGFLFDDPGRPTTATLPTPAWLPLALRVAGGGIVLAGWWWGTLVTAGAVAGPAGVVLPRRDLTLEAVTVVVAVLALAALIWRRSARGGVGLVAAPAFLAVVFLAALLPERVALLVPFDDSVWAAAHDRWMVTLVAATAVALVAATWSGLGKARFTV